MSFDTTINANDIEILIEAVNDWEMMGSHEFHVMNIVKNITIPQEADSEMAEGIRQLKEYFRNREKDIKATRSLRQEQAVFLKTKLMMLRKDMAITQVFQEAQKPLDENEEIAKKTPSAKKIPVADAKTKNAIEFLKKYNIFQNYEEAAPINGLEKHSLADMEEYIEECSMTSIYCKYLQDQAQSNES